MYFYTQFSHNQHNRFQAANLVQSEIYTELLQEFYDKYKLPALHHDGDGFRQGDASDEELAELATTLKIELNADEEDRFFPIFHFLDKEFMSIEEEAYDAALAVHEAQGFAKFLIENLIEDSSLQNQYTSYYTIFSEVSEGIDYEWTDEGNEGEPTREFCIESILNTDWEEHSNVKGWDWEKISNEMLEFGYSK